MGDFFKNHNRWEEGKSLASWQEFKSFLLYYFLFFFKLGSRKKTPPNSLCLRQNFMVTLLQVSVERDVGCDLHHVLWKCSRHQTVPWFLSASFYSD